jgi:splicing factor 3A subunit 3
MTSSILELMRNTHEDVERIEQAGARILFEKSRRRILVSSELCIDYLSKLANYQCKELTSLYEDNDALRADEIKEIGGEGGHDVWHSFYSKIKHTKEFYRMHSEQQQPKIFDVDYWYSRALEEATERSKGFSGDEYGGRCVDLGLSFQEYSNLHRLRDHRIKEFVRHQWVKFLKSNQAKGCTETVDYDEFSRSKSKSFKHVDYVTWLREFHSFENIPRYLKYKQQDYSKYLLNLSSYLEGFIRRQRPLLDIDSRLASFVSEFDDLWNSRSIPGWALHTSESDFFVLATDRVFANENTMKGHFNSKEYAKAIQRLNSLDSEGQSKLLTSSHKRDRDIAETESRIHFFRDLLAEVIEDTIDHVTRKQARTAHEVAMELSRLEGGEAILEDVPDDLSEAGSSGGEEIDVNDRSIYNPKNIPLGPDGKPIPYWQFKLFGLDKEFPCEICGNHTYFGRRVFEKHFSEWRHINGLRALRIPNSNHFYGVVGIEDAILLNQKLRQDTASSIFNADKEMECEDAMGNVMSYRAYQDLLRQGLV